MVGDERRGEERMGGEGGVERLWLAGYCGLLAENEDEKGREREGG